MEGNTNYLLIGLVLGWLTLALGLLLYRGVRKWWHNRRYGTPIDHSVLLVEYGRKMTGVPDRQALGKLLTIELPRALQVGQAVLLLPEAHQLVATKTNDLRLPVSHAAVRWVASGGEAQRADRGRLHDLIQQGRAERSAERSQRSLTWAQVWVPLMRGADLRGMWLLGARDGGVQYAPEDLRWLTAVAREAAAVLEATHYAEQERQTASEMRALYHQVVAARETERGRLSIRYWIICRVVALNTKKSWLPLRFTPGRISSHSLSDSDHCRNSRFSSGKLRRLV